MNNVNVSNILWKHGMIRIEFIENKILNKMFNIESTITIMGFSNTSIMGYFACASHNKHNLCMKGSKTL
jgi:hypothetical protein